MNPRTIRPAGRWLLALSAIIACAAGLATPALAADKMEHIEHGAMHATTAGDAALSDGLVKKVDKNGGKLTVAHGPLPGGMPGMTMAFRVKDAAWLDTLKEGQKIRFAIDDKMTITRLETAK
jgi:Cu(I)/Ag(I) efflux system periplasmic protein CusF